jgi:HTH-type transcriptional regulator/antitoxin HigA
LFHELSHLTLHLEDKNTLIFDDLKSTNNLSDIEKEADHFGEEKLIPRKVWESFYSAYLTEEDVKNFAKEQRLSPAVVAGRIQKERNDYSVFRKLLGQDEVKRLFK